MTGLQMDYFKFGAFREANFILLGRKYSKVKQGAESPSVKIYWWKLNKQIRKMFGF